MNAHRCLVAAGLLVLACPALAQDQPACAWKSLFNGHDLDGWIPKVRGYPAGEDPLRTFRVEDGLLSVAYDAYTEFDERFGHLFYATPHSRYRLRLDYRFHGEQVPGGPDWAWRNSGVMLHSPEPARMGVDQDFPVSIEVQLLGGRGDGSVRHTANLCTPGTNVVYAGAFDTRHCIESASPTFDGDQWVHLEIRVLADEAVVHVVNGEEVMRYGGLTAGGGAVSGAEAELTPDGSPMASGWFSLQSESHPVQFRNIELLDLEACPENPL